MLSLIFKGMFYLVDLLLWAVVLHGFMLNLINLSSSNLCRSTYRNKVLICMLVFQIRWPLFTFQLMWILWIAIIKIRVCNLDIGCHTDMVWSVSYGIILHQDSSQALFIIVLLETEWHGSVLKWFQLEPICTG